MKKKDRESAALFRLYGAVKKEMATERKSSNCGQKRIRQAEKGRLDARNCKIEKTVVFLTVGVILEVQGAAMTESRF